MEDGRLDNGVFKKWGETLVGGASGTNTTSSYTVNLTSGNVFNLILNANCAFTFSNPPGSGTTGSFTLILTQDGTGGRTVTWPAAVVWSGATAPTLTTAPGKKNILSFFTTNGGSVWYGAFQQNSFGPPTLDYITSSSSTSDLTTYTFSGVSIGTATSDRLVIVGAASTETGGLRTVSSISIGGINGTLHEAPAGDWHPVGLASRAVSSGTTADIVVTFSGGVARCMIFVWTLKNYVSATPYDSDSIQGTSSISRSVTFNIPAHGVAVYVASKGADTSFTWSSATENANLLVETYRAAGAYKTTTAPITSHVETVTYGVSSGGNGLAGASWV